MLVTRITDKTTNVECLKKVAVLEDFYEICKRYHEQVVKHLGMNGTLDAISKDFFGIPRPEFVKCCNICNLKKKSIKHGPVFCQFGLPSIVQTDNGKEFNNQVTDAIN